MTSKITIVIPMAGIGKRLIPLTLTKPKPLLSIAGKRLIDYVLDTFGPLQKMFELDYVFIIGYRGEQIKQYMEEQHPEKKVSYIVQEKMLGQSHALWLAKDYLKGPLMITYCDTLIHANISIIKEFEEDGVIWVKEVEDPRRFGVVEVDQNSNAVKLIEKPKSMKNRLAVVGLYYFQDGEALVNAIETQIQLEKTLGGEFYLVDAVNILLERGERLKVEQADLWLDAGTQEAMIETNFALLNQNGSYYPKEKIIDSVIIPPVCIDESTTIESSIIGPNVSIDANCVIKNSIIKNSIIEEYSIIVQINMEDSLIGVNNKVQGSSTTLIMEDG